MNRVVLVLHNIKLKVSMESIKSSTNSLVDNRLNRIITHHSNHLSTDDMCTFQTKLPTDVLVTKTLVLLSSTCPLHNNQRKIMITTILNSYKDNDNPQNTRLIDVPVLLGPNEELPNTVREDIKSSVFDCILNTSSTIMIKPLFEFTILFVPVISRCYHYYEVRVGLYVKLLPHRNQLYQLSLAVAQCKLKV